MDENVPEREDSTGRDTSDKEVSPYLLRPCRTYEEYLRDRRRAAAEREYEEAVSRNPQAALSD